MRERQSARPEPRHRRIGRPELLLLLASCAVALLLGEVGLRIHYAVTASGSLRDLDEALPPPGSAVKLGEILRRSEHPRLVYQLKPGLDVVYRGAAVVTNSLGWREKELPLAKDGGVIRIVGLGDSVMFGHGVEVSERYMDVLEGLLNRSYPEERWETVTLAVSGYNLVMEVEALRRFGLRYEPDLVVYGFLGNDFCLPNFVSERRQVRSLDSFLYDYLRRAVAPRRGAEEAAAGSGLAPYRTALAEAPGAADGERAGQFSESFCQSRDVAREYRHLVGRESFRAALEELAAIGRERGIPIVLMNYTRDRASAKIPEVDGILSVNVARPFHQLAVRRGFASLRHSDLVLRPDDTHPSPKGHRVIAELLLERLVHRGLVADLLARRGGAAG